MHDPEKKTDNPAAKPGLPKFKVFIHNDQITPLAVVLDTLRYVFHKDYANAAKIAQKAEAEGKALVGEFHFELAEHKAEMGMTSPLEMALLLEKKAELDLEEFEKTHKAIKPIFLRAKRKELRTLLNAAIKARKKAEGHKLKFTIERS